MIVWVRFRLLESVEILVTIWVFDYFWVLYCELLEAFLGEDVWHVLEV